MARIILGGRSGVAENKISEKSSERDSNHDPAIVSHEDQPAGKAEKKPARKKNQWSKTRKKETYHRYSGRGVKSEPDSHEHEGVKVLDPVQDGLDDVSALAGILLVSSWREERRGLIVSFVVFQYWERERERRRRFSALGTKMPWRKKKGSWNSRGMTDSLWLMASSYVRERARSAS